MEKSLNLDAEAEKPLSKTLSDVEEEILMKLEDLERKKGDRIRIVCQTKKTPKFPRDSLFSEILKDKHWDVFKSLLYNHPRVGLRWISSNVVLTPLEENLLILKGKDSLN